MKYLVFIFILLFSFDVAALTPQEQAYFEDVAARKAKHKKSYEDGMQHERDGNFAKAASSYLRGLKDCGDMVLADMMRVRLIDAYLALEKPVKAFSQVGLLRNPQLRLLAQGNYYLKIRNYRHALNSFCFYLTSFSGEDSTDIYLNMAESLFRLGRVNDALSAYLHVVDVLRLAPSIDGLDKAYYGAGWCCLKNQEFDRAAYFFEHTLKVSHDEVIKRDALSWLGQIYSDKIAAFKRSGDDVRVSFYTLLLIDAGYNMPLSGFDYALTLEKSGQSGKAALVYQKIVDGYKSSELYIKSALRLGKIYEDENEKDKALAVYNMVVASGVPEAKIARERIEGLKFK